MDFVVFYVDNPKVINTSFISIFICLVCNYIILVFIIVVCLNSITNDSLCFGNLRLMINTFNNFVVRKSIFATDKVVSAHFLTST